MLVRGNGLFLISSPNSVMFPQSSIGIHPVISQDCRMVGWREFLFLKNQRCSVSFYLIVFLLTLLSAADYHMWKSPVLHPQALNSAHRPFLCVPLIMSLLHPVGNTPERGFIGAKWLADGQYQMKKSETPNYILFNHYKVGLTSNYFNGNDVCCRAAVQSCRQNRFY